MKSKKSSTTLTEQDLLNIEKLIDRVLDEKLEEKLEVKLEEKLETKLEEKLEAKFEEKLESKLEEKLESKFEEKLAPIKKSIKNLDIKVSQLELRIIRFEKTFEERSSYWENFSNGVDSFMGEVIKSREERVFSDARLDKHDKRICVLEAGVFHKPLIRAL